MSIKTLSVVVPNYNDVDYIGKSLMAICEQSFSPTEVIVVDDGSIDNSIEVIEELAARYSCIQLVRNEINRGVIYSVNRAANLATGDYIYLASANDFVLSGFFEKSMNLLAEYPHAGLCCTNSREMRIKEGTMFDYLYDWLPEPGYLSSRQVARIAHTTDPLCLGAPNTIFRRDLLPQHQVYIPELESWADWFLCQVTILRHGCCYIPEVLAIVNSVENSQSSSDRRNHQVYQQACAKLYQLLASRDYEDIAPLVMRCRSLHHVSPVGKHPYIVLNALCKAPSRNKYALALLLHLLENYIYGLVPNSIVVAPRIIKSMVQRIVLQPVHDTFVTIICFLQNVCDRAYARSFHEYDRVRTAIRKQLRTIADK